MQRVTIDFETRSEIDLRKVGGWKYSEHPTTEIMVLAYKIDDQVPYLWVAPKFMSEEFLRIVNSSSDMGFVLDSDNKPSRLLSLIEAGIEIEAHNAVHFELAVWKNVAVKKLGWADIEDHQWRCSQAKCAAHNLCQSLEKAAQARGLLQRKDDEGHRLMLKMCKPRRPTKKDFSKWWEEPADIVRLAKYCAQDVNTEYELSQSLMDLSPYETKVFELDLKINSRGVYADVETAQKAIDIIADRKKELAEETYQLTNGKVPAMTQVQKAKAFFESRGFPLPNFSKNAVTDLLNNPELPEDLRRLCEIRQSIGKTSITKLQAIINRAMSDNRVRGIFAYHRASTGRWGGVGIQPQNFPSRAALKDKPVSHVLGYIKKRQPDAIDLIYGDFNNILSGCLRGFLQAGPGKTFVCSDYSSIEARVLAWLANEESVLTTFKEGRDVYKTAAAGIFGISYEEIDSGSPVSNEAFERLGLPAGSVKQRAIGKVSVLALGYQGGWRAYVNMASVYGIKPPVKPLAKEDLIDDMTEEPLAEEEALWKLFAQPIVKKWRESNPAIVSLWWELENAAIEAIMTGKVVDVRNMVQFGVGGDFLFLRLPSGRLLSYYKPSVVMKEMPWNDKKGNKAKKEVVKFWGIESQSRKFRPLFTYGGMLAENVVQAISRDIMADAMLRLQSQGADIVLHIHDEIVVETNENNGMSVEELEAIMSEVPKWAEGLPLKASGGWKGKRFRK